MPRYKTAVFGDAPGTELDASREAVTPLDAAQKAVSAHMLGRRISDTSGAHIGRLHYFAAVDRYDATDQVIVTVRELG